MRLFQVVKPASGSKHAQPAQSRGKNQKLVVEDMTHYQWSHAEEEAFIELHKKYGNKWALLARKFKGK